jgi:hypothetical protein
VAIPVIAIGTIVAASALLGEHSAEENNAAVNALTDAAMEVGADQLVRLEYDPQGFASSSMMFAVVNQLDARGTDICLDEGFALYVGASRICRGRSDFHLLVRDEGVALDPPTNAELLTTSDQLTPALRAEMTTLTADLRDVLTRNGLSDRAPLLDTELAELAIADQDVPEVLGRSEDFARLAELRSLPAGRFSIYVATST